MGKQVLLTLIFIAVFQCSFSQESSKSLLSYSAGFGFHSQDNYLSGVGAEINFGYKHMLKSDRLRLYPSIAIGSYLSGSKNDDRDKYFNSATLNFFAEYDLIRYKSIALNFDVGGFAGLTKGLYGTGTEFQNATSTDIMFEESVFINKVNYGLSVATGLRIAKPEKRCAVTIIPVNLKIGSNALLQLQSMIQMDINLCGK